MTRQTLALLAAPLLAAPLLVACGGPLDPSQLDTGDDDAPLSSHRAVFHGAPRNADLPSLGKADAVYPRRSTELVALQSPVKNQGHRGDCTIFTTTALMEHLYLKAGMKGPSFSEQYLQWSVKAQLGVLPTYEGSNIADNVEAIHRFGIVDSATYPYNPNPWTEANDPACKSTGAEGETLPMKCWTEGDPPASVQAAKKYTLPSGRYLNTSDIKMNIATRHAAVAVGLDFFYQAWNHRLSTLPVDAASFARGIVRAPNAADVTESHKQQAGHGILIVGWDDDLAFPQVDAKGQTVKDAKGHPVMEKGFYIFKNSWGTDRFGVQNPVGKGYGYIAYRYVDQYGTAYVTDPPVLQSTPPTVTCKYACKDYGYVAGQCRGGWSCDAKGACLTYTRACH